VIFALRKLLSGSKSPLHASVIAKKHSNKNIYKKYFISIDIRIYVNILMVTIIFKVRRERVPEN